MKLGIQIKLLLTYIIFITAFLSSEAQAPDSFVSLHLKNQTYQDGKVLELQSEYFYNVDEGILVVHGFKPREHLKVSNRFGEVKVYFLDDNSVSIQQNPFYSSENELIHYFLTNNFYDLGLSKEGYSISRTKMDGQHQVVTWEKIHEGNPIPKIELVFENDKPIYAAYFNTNGKIVRKVYYYNYQFFRSFMMPQKVTQISYTPKGDSIVQRNTYSDINVVSTPSSQYFNFKIPDDAKILE